MFVLLATVPEGFEPSLVRELAQLAEGPDDDAVQRARVRGPGIVQFRATTRGLARVLVGCRCCQGLRLRLLTAANTDELATQMQAFPWSDWLPPGITLTLSGPLSSSLALEAALGRGGAERTGNALHATIEETRRGASLWIDLAAPAPGERACAADAADAADAGDADDADDADDEAAQAGEAPGEHGPQEHRAQTPRTPGSVPTPPGSLCAHPLPASGVPQCGIPACIAALALRVAGAPPGANIIVLPGEHPDALQEDLVREAAFVAGGRPRRSAGRWPGLALLPVAQHLAFEQAALDARAPASPGEVFVVEPDPQRRVRLQAILEATCASAPIRFVDHEGAVGTAFAKTPFIVSVLGPAGPTPLVDVGAEAGAHARAAPSARARAVPAEIALALADRLRAQRRCVHVVLAQELDLESFGAGWWTSRPRRVESGGQAWSLALHAPTMVATQPSTRAPRREPRGVRSTGAPSGADPAGRSMVPGPPVQAAAAPLLKGQVLEGQVLKGQVLEGQVLEGQRARESAAPDGAVAARMREVLLRNTSHRRRWTERLATDAYRLYDRELPDLPWAVDRYGDFLHVTIYGPPATPDPRAEARCLLALSEVLSVDPARVFVKHKARRAGGAQHERLGREGTTCVVREAGLRFLVNLSDYVDTGLFLDQRLSRARLRSLARDRRFLNLFSYTGSFTVCAAAGGARATTSVDASQVVLDWARTNLRLNDLDGPTHRWVRGDALEFLHRHAQGPAYDLAVVDPPTFSNRRRGRYVWDVQRDHATLLQALAPLVSASGTVLFSTNLRSFRLDRSGLSAWHVEAAGPASIPPDFHDRRIHQAYWLTRAV